MLGAPSGAVARHYEFGCHLGQRSDGGIDDGSKAKPLRCRPPGRACKVGTAVSRSACRTILIAPACWQDVIAFLVLVAVLMFRPSGLLGEAVRG